MSAVTSRPRIRSVIQAAADFRTVTAKPEFLETCGGEQGSQLASLLVAACRNASVSAGFPDFTHDRISPQQIRMVSTSPAGHALITELDLPLDGEPSMITEIVGLRDGTCNRVLDRFDHALEEEGVRSDAPTRRSTGGACYLAAAKAFTTRLVPKRAAGLTEQCDSEPSTARKRRRPRAASQARGGRE